VRLGDDKQVCHRLLQRLTFSKTRHNRDIFPPNTMAYDREEKFTEFKSYDGMPERGTPLFKWQKTQLSNGTGSLNAKI